MIEIRSCLTVRVYH